LAGNKSKEEMERKSDFLVKFAAAKTEQINFISFVFLNLAEFIPSNHGRGQLS